MTTTTKPAATRILSETIEFFEPSIFERIVGGINLMGVRCSNASFEKNIFLFVRASSANSKFRLFFLASKFDACGDAGELFKDFSYF